MPSVSEALRRAAKRFGTPAYVVDMLSVTRAAKQVEAAFGGWVLQYSVKANDLPAIIAFVHRHGWGASVVSTGEWRHASVAGVGNGDIAFEGIGKTDDQLDYAVREAVAGRALRWLAVESPEEAGRLAALASARGLGRDGTPGLDVLVRLNPDVRPETRAEFAVGTRASKFGMSRERILALVRAGGLSGPGLRLRGVHVHVGSDLNDVSAWALAGVAAVRLLRELHELMPGRASIDTVDFGGGFPVPDAEVPPPSQFRAALEDALAIARLSLPARPAIEPGRFLVGGGGWLISSVLHSRQSGEHTRQAVVDAGMTELIRPALYGSRHPLHVLGNGCGRLAHPTYETEVEGPVCELTDSFGSYSLPRLKRGDLIAFENTGAYAASFTSRYNGRPQPAEVLFWPDGSLQLATRPAPHGTVPHPGPRPGSARPGRESPGRRVTGVLERCECSTCSSRTATSTTEAVQHRFVLT
jgi:diaminopimelate decarboxylase